MLNFIIINKIKVSRPHINLSNQSCGRYVRYSWIPRSQKSFQKLPSHYMGIGRFLSLCFLDSNDDALSSTYLQYGQPRKIKGALSLQKVIKKLHYYLKFNLKTISSTLCDYTLICKLRLALTLHLNVCFSSIIRPSLFATTESSLTSVTLVHVQQ